MFRAQQLIFAIGLLVRGVLQAVRVVAAGPAVEVAHVGAQASLVHDRYHFQLGMGRHFAVVRVDVSAVAGGVEQVAVRFAAWTDAGANRWRVLQHAHRVAGRRHAVDDDIVLGGADVLLLDLGWQTAFVGDGEARGYLYACCAGFQEADGVAAGKDAACRDQRNVEVLVLQVSQQFLGDGHQVVFGPVHAKAQVAAGQRSFDNDEVGQTVELGVFAQEDLQRAYRRYDDAQLGFAEARMIGHQRERTEVQTGRQRDAVDAGVQRCVQARAQGFTRTIHGQLFHAVHKDQAWAFLGFHGLADMQALGFGQALEIELHDRLVRVIDVELVELGFILDEAGIETTIRYVFDHGVRNMANATESRGFQRQFRRRDIDTHSADHDGHVFVIAKSQAEIINTFHCYP